MTNRREVALVLTVAYCRVSTEDQAEEGFSMDGQADKLRSYADLRDLGEVTVVNDPGWSGKNLKRPGLEKLLQDVKDRHVAHVLVWRLDRISRTGRHRPGKRRRRVLPDRPPRHQCGPGG